MPADKTPDQWQSIDQWMDSPQFRDMMRDEFPEDAAEWLDPVSRRQALAVMGASVALATGCNPSLKPASVRKVIPYVKQPTDVLPGIPLFFATAMPQVGGVGLGLIAKSAEGRPIKLEGNPGHPSSLGATNLAGQGGLLGLYDPDRSQQVLFNGTPNTFENAVNAVREALDAQKGKQGEGVRVVTEPTTSPTFARLMAEFLRQFPKAKWLQYEPLANDNELAAQQAAFGKPVNPVYDFGKADVVLSLDSDFLSAGGPGGVRYSRDFASRRKVRSEQAGLDAKDGGTPDQMSRLYAVESMFTCTGGTADHRLPVKPTDIEQFARALATKLGVPGAGGAVTGRAAAFLDAVVPDLQKAGAKSLVVAGPTQPPAVHLLAMAVNDKLGAVGQTVRYTEPLRPNPAPAIPPLRELVADLQAGKVDLLYLCDVNPVYDAPADLDFKTVLSAFKGVSVHHGLYADETAVHCRWHLNAAHFLEMWGDVRGHDGTVALVQPLIAPLHGGRTAAELFGILTGLAAGDPFETVKATWRGFFDAEVKGPEFDIWWNTQVREGVVERTAAKPAGVGAVSLAGLAGFAPAPGGGLELQLRPCPGLYDGRYANNGWLQEVPKPVTCLSWDNAAIVSPNTADKMGLYGTHWFTGDTGNQFAWTAGERGRTNAPLAEFTLNGRKLTAAVFILPGHADDAVTLDLGHGRDRAGKVGSPSGQGWGFNAYRLRGTDTLWGGAGLTGQPTGGGYILACTQGQYAMEGRRPARSATKEQFKAKPEFAQIPAATAGEFREIRALTPGTPEDFARLGKKHPFADGHGHAGHDHTHDEGKGEHAHEGGQHDSRVIPLSLYPEYPQEVKGGQASVNYRRWGMGIDLNACTGCATCVVACQAENNIPVIGKHEVSRGRAMHWIRIDRYFSIPGADEGDDQLGDKTVRNRERAEQARRAADVRVHFQPVFCVHCEKAPCEQVCPVGATIHDADGINNMVYNRCVGTRYCSNNCPYKVRRFNFLQYADYHTPSLKLVNNNEVTVRQRGVMEKCTYCIQRIRNAEMQAEREFATRPKDAVGRPKIFDGEVQTACQQACPTRAIVFGDINDPTSAVLRWKAEPTGYGLLAELNTMPRTTHIAQVRNDNPALSQQTTKGGA